MAGRAGRHATLIVALGATFAALPAQSARLELRLAADQDHHGPTAWTWVRAHLLHSIAPGIEDPFAALTATIAAGATPQVAVDPAPDASAAYLRFTLVTDAGVRAEGTCDATGREQWIAPAGLELEDLPEQLRSLCARFGYEARTGWLSLDLSTALGNLMAGAVEGDPVSEALTLGASECGTVAVLARRNDSGGMQIDGNSGGGLLLPALLIALADDQAGRIATTEPTPLAQDVDRWLLLAASAEREEQEEAARQLGRFKDPRAVRALERLLHGDGLVRLIAIHGLVRQGSVRSLGAIVAAADPRQPGTVSLAASAIWSLAPEPVAIALVRALPPQPQARNREPAPARMDLLDMILMTSSVLTLSSVIALVVMDRRHRSQLGLA